jgi:hypothetical protein
VEHRFTGTETFFDWYEHHYLAAVGDEALGFLCVIANKEIINKFI